MSLSNPPQPQSTIDSEVEEILHTLLNFRDPWSQLDKAETKLTNLIAQEANKARQSQTDHLFAVMRHLGYEIDRGAVVKLSREWNITADKEQAE